MNTASHSLKGYIRQIKLFFETTNFYYLHYPEFMNTFVSDILPKLQRFSQKLDNLTLLTNQHWVSIDNILSKKIVYIFRSNNELLVSVNGKLERSTWEYLGDRSLIINTKEESHLFKHGFFDENILALKIDGSEEYIVFVNENKFNGDLDSIEKVFHFLKEKYLDPTLKSQVEDVTGFPFNSYQEERNISLKEQETIDSENDKEVSEITLWIIGFIIVFIALVISYSMA